MRADRVKLDDEWSLWRRFAVRSPGLPVEFVAAFAVPELADGDGGPDRDGRTREVTAAAMWDALADDTFMAALTWQNPSVVETWAQRLSRVARSGQRPPVSRRNERERLISRYAQRYAVKNESIGFFGPVGWGEFGAGPEPLAWRGDLGIRHGAVFFEVWAIAALARAWSRRADLRPHLPVRLHPAATVRDGQVHRPRRPPVVLTPAAAAVLAQAGSDRPYATMLSEAALASGLDVGTIGAAATELETEGLLRTGFRVPFDEHPERHLRVQAERIADDRLRDMLIGHLDRLDEARGDVAKVTREPERLRAALDVLGVELNLAGGTARRDRPGNGMGRTAVYPDCRRDLDVEVGPPLLAALRAPLGLLLRSADWLAAEIALAVQRRLAAVYARLSRDRAVVTLADLQLAATDALVPGAGLVTEVMDDFQLRWAELLPRSPAGPVRVDSGAVRPMAEALFPYRRPLWAAARHHTPDLLISRQPDGAYRWVLGELHVALNTLESRLFVTQYERRDELVAATRADFPGGRIVPLYPPDGTASNSRTYPPPALDPPGAFRYWSYAADDGHEHGHVPVPATAIRVVRQDGRLLGVAEGWQAPVVEFFGEFLTAMCVNAFQPRRHRPYAPRVLLDDLVIGRETWRFAATEVPLPSARPRDHSYAGLRRWARGNGMPRHVFVHVAGEPKPVYADLAAPALLDNVARLVRAAAPDAMVTVTEMLPGPDELWLADGAGRHWTAELRVVATRDGADPVWEVRP